VTSLKKTRKVPVSKKMEALNLVIFKDTPDGLIISDLGTGLVVDANPSFLAMHGYTQINIMGKKLMDFIALKNQFGFNALLQKLHSGELLDVRVSDVRNDDSIFPAHWRGTAYKYKRHLRLLASVRDDTKQVGGEILLRKRVTARTREQAALLDISHSMASTLEFQPGLILDQLREIVDYSRGGLFAMNESGLVAMAMRGTSQLETSKSFKFNKQRPESLAMLYNGHRPIRIADVTIDKPPSQFLFGFLGGEERGLLEGMRSWMWVPLAVKGRFLGGIGVSHEKRNFFTSHHANLVLSVADQAAITMVNAELYQHAGELAALQERQRLAQNLHDAVNQSLFSAGLIAEVLPRLWDRDQEEARRSLEDLRRLTRGALAEMRGMLAELRPTVLTDSSLGDLIRQLANAFTGRTNVPVSIAITGEHVLPAEIQVALYRVCQETLNNIAKHAQASQVEIELNYAGSTVGDTGNIPTISALSYSGVPQEIVVRSVEMRIRDNGIGFNPGEVTAPGHYGLGMMLERAETVGAQLTYTSQPGHGSEIRLFWPHPGKKETL
jgi:PAS domain S-box-containing protein